MLRLSDLSKPVPQYLKGSRKDVLQTEVANEQRLPLPVIVSVMHVSLWLASFFAYLYRTASKTPQDL